jgi:hypothetical protein
VAGTRGKMTKPAIGPGVRLFSPAVLGFSTASPTAGTSSGRSGSGYDASGVLHCRQY